MGVLSWRAVPGVRRWRWWALGGAALLGIVALVPVAVAWSDDELSWLPRPQRSGSPAETPEVATVVVQLKDGAGTQAVTSRGATVLGPVDGTDFIRVRPGGDPRALVTELSQDPSVAAVSLDYARRLFATPNDEYYASVQQGYLNAVRMPQAWDRITDASSQVVAVIDTGVQLDHSDLVGRLVPGYNAVNPGAAPADIDGHGTFVAGVIAANTNNGIGTAGVAWNGRVMPIQVFTGEFAFDSDIAEGIIWAVNHGASIINLSLGGPGDNPLLHAAVQYAADRNVVVVAASGNDGNDVPQYPAAYPEVIAVGATDAAGRLVDFSSFGEHIDVVAPGLNIVSSTIGGWIGGHGTSFAAPIVSGIAALVRAQNPALSQDQVGNRLRAATRDAGPRGIDPYYGHGLIDAAYALGAPAVADLPLPALGPGEPNDVPDRATPLTTTATGSLAVEGDVDWYRFEMPTPHLVTVTFVAPGPVDANGSQQLDPVVEVLNADLGRIASLQTTNWVSGASVTVLVDAGVSYLRVHNRNGATDDRPYGLTVSPAGGLPLQPQVLQLGTAHNEHFPATAIGDVTGDGVNDVVLASYDISPTYAETLLVLAGRADGSLDDPVVYTVTQYGLAAIALLDANRDGRMDVAVVEGDKIEIFHQTEAGTLSSGGLISTGISVTRETAALIAVDIDDDGDTDLVHNGGDIPAGRVHLLIHEDDDTFTPQLVDDERYTDLDVGDINGDGRLDLVAPDALQRLNIYTNLPTGWSWSGTWLTGIFGIRSIVVDDVTGDGLADVVSVEEASAGNGRVVVVAQNADGTLAAPVTYSVGLKYYTVATGDLNADGRTDVMTLNADGVLSILYQQANGTLSAPSSLGGLGVIGARPPNSLVVGELAGDSRPEVVVETAPLRIIRHQTVADQHDVVRAVTPVEHSTGVAVAVSPQVTFMADLDESTVDESTVRLVDGRTGDAVAAAVDYDPATRTATIDPAAALHGNKPYRVVVDGVSDSSGRPLRPFSSVFVTADSAPTALQGFTATGRVGSAINLSYVVPAGDVDQVIVRVAAGTTPPASPTAGSHGVAAPDLTGVTIGGLNPGATYSVSAWYRDRSGALSPPSTATLRGTTLTMAVTSSTTAGSAKPTLAFSGVLTAANPTQPAAGVGVDLIVFCRNERTGERPLVAVISAGAGVLTHNHQQPYPSCTYRWELSGSSTFMGATSTTVRTAGAALAPPQPAPNR